MSPDPGGESPVNGEPRPWVLARKLQAIAQTGLAYSANEYDRERYHSVAAAAAELLSLQCDTPAETFQAVFNSQDGYATPKIDVRTAVFRDGRILLVREAADGLWTLPGGWADVNDSPSEAAERETFEETGFRVKAIKLAVVYDRAKHPHHPPLPFHVYKMFFIGEILGGAATPSRETPAVDFFSPNALPPLSCSRVLPEQIQRMLAHINDPVLPTDFD